MFKGSEKIHSGRAPALFTFITATRMEMNRKLFLKIYYLVHILIQNPNIGSDGFSTLQLTPPPLWALLNFTVMNASLQVAPAATTSATCKMTCFVLPNCSYAFYHEQGENGHCRIGSLNITRLYKVSPLANSISIFNPNGYGLYNIANGTSSRFKNLPNAIIKVAQYTKLYYSLREPNSVYWVLNKPMSRAEAIGNCSGYSSTSLAYFSTLAQLEIGFFILTDQYSTLTVDQHSSRPTIHVDMKTVRSGIFLDLTWSIIYGPNNTSISQTQFADDSRVQIHGLSLTNTLYLQWSDGLTFSNHNDDNKVAALCFTKVFGYFG